MLGCRKRPLYIRRRGCGERNPVKKITKLTFPKRLLPYTRGMRALVYTAPGKVEMQDPRRPTLQAGEREVAIEFAGVCGSDISGFLGHSALRKPPLVLGHELVGRLPDGRRVVANPLLSCGRCSTCLS